ncbi:hypothetical protein CHISP_1958 [Chitinispirillum alkaliphilum]|nr:hypothetical protein CHISP_1958 [Chitinispirillum alkaliphilum]
MKISNCSGSSLVEVIISMFILALLVVGLNFCVVNLIGKNVAAKDISAATASGNQLLEQMRRADFNEIVSGSDMQDQRFIRSWTVTDDGDMRRIELTVFWPENESRSISMSTMVARP